MSYAIEKTPWTLRETWDAVERREVWKRPENGPRQAAFDFFGQDMLLQDLDTEHVDLYIAWLQSVKQYKPATVNKYVSLLSKAYTLAKEYRRVSENAPTPKYRRVTNDAKRKPNFAYEDEASMCKELSRIGGRDLAAFFTFLVDTGVRAWSEGLALKVRDVDLENATITIWKSKGKVARTIPLTRAVRDMLESRCAGRFPDDCVWDTITRSRFFRAWERAKQAIGKGNDPDWVIHGCRHTCASRLAMGGMDVFRIKEWLGHKNINSTMVYMHLAPASLKLGVQILEQSQASQGETLY